MCGSLRREKTKEKIGNPVEREYARKGDFVPTSLGEAIFNGFARQENLDFWIKKGWKKALILVKSYTEGRPPVEFDVPEGYAIGGLVMEVSGKKFVNVVTREATEEEAKIHHRFPLLVKIKK